MELEQACVLSLLVVFNRLVKVYSDFAERADRVLLEQPRADALRMEVVPRVAWQVCYVALSMPEVVHADRAECHGRVYVLVVSDFGEQLDLADFD